MPSPPRIVLPGTVVLVSSRVESGLPFVCTVYMKLILRSCLARAQALYPVKICDYLFMGNHLHLLMLVTDPEAIRDFMDRFKTESAHAINRLLGRRKRTVWCDSYDCVPILTLGDVIEKIAYIYTNPQAAGLVDTIEEYPGLSSWAMRSEHRQEEEVPWIRRSTVPKLEAELTREHEQERFARELLSTATKSNTFKLTPDAWLEVFGIREPREVASVHEKILSRIRDLEAKHREERSKSKKSCLGRARLISQPLDLPYEPKKFSKRMWCISSDIDLRVRFINFIKSLIKKAKEVQRRWRLGDFVPYPTGLFPPTFPRLSNLVPPPLR